MSFKLPVFPVQASTFAEDVDAIFFVLTVLTVFFSVVVLALMVFFAIRYRRGAKVDRSRPVHSDLRIELAWSIIPLILALGVFFWAAKPYASVYSPPKNAREIFVIGKQWMWHIQHSNGIRENNELHIPVGQPIQLTLISQDVIHDFFIPAFRAKRDAIPGRYTTFWFQPTKVGKYHLFCAEYCGTQHSDMIGYVYVMKPADFQAWLASGGERNAGVAKPAGEVETMAAAGEKLYTQLACGSCHDVDGLQRGPSLIGLYGSQVETADGQTHTADEAFLRKAILYSDQEIIKGYAQDMPSYKDSLNEDQVLQIIAYIRSLATVAPSVKKTKKSPVTPVIKPNQPTGTQGAPTNPPASQEGPNSGPSYNMNNQSRSNTAPIKTARATNFEVAENTK